MTYVDQEHLREINLFRLVGTFHITDGLDTGNMDDLRLLNTFNPFKVLIS